MTRIDMLNYLIKPDMEWLRESLEKKSYSELKNIYDRHIIADEIIKDIIENGITTYRISYKADKEIQKEIVDYIKQNNMYCFYDGRIDWNIHIGNYCIVGIAEKFITELKNKFGDIIYSVDLKRTTLSKKDISGLKEGDKVNIISENMFGGYSGNQGTVFKIEDNEITIRAYRSKTKGYRLRIGEPGSIEKISKFKTA